MKSYQNEGQDDLQKWRTTGIGFIWSNDVRVCALSDINKLYKELHSNHHASFCDREQSFSRIARRVRLLPKHVRPMKNGSFQSIAPEVLSALPNGPGQIDHATFRDKHRILLCKHLTVIRTVFLCHPSAIFLVFRALIMLHFTKCYLYIPKLYIHYIHIQYIHK